MFLLIVEDDKEIMLSSNDLLMCLLCLPMNGRIELFLIGSLCLKTPALYPSLIFKSDDVADLFLSAKQWTVKNVVFIDRNFIVKPSNTNSNIIF